MGRVAAAQRCGGFESMSVCVIALRLRSMWEGSEAGAVRFIAASAVAVAPASGVGLPWLIAPTQAGLGRACPAEASSARRSHERCWLAHLAAFLRAARPAGDHTATNVGEVSTGGAAAAGADKP